MTNLLASIFGIATLLILLNLSLFVIYDWLFGRLLKRERLGQKRAFKLSLLYSLGIAIFIIWLGLNSFFGYVCAVLFMIGANILLSLYVKGWDQKFLSYINREQ